MTNPLIDYINELWLIRKGTQKNSIENIIAKWNINVIYGSLGSPNSYLFVPGCAISITSIGRHIIKSIDQHIYQVFIDS